MRAIKVDGELWIDIKLALRMENEERPGRWDELLNRILHAEQKDSERRIWGEEKGDDK